MPRRLGRPLPGGAGQRQALDLEDRPRLDRVRLVVQRGDLAADHPAHDLVGRGLRPRRRGDELAVAEHGHPVGQREDLVHLVADVQHGGAGLAQVVDHAEEPGDLRVRQRRGRLVHDHDRGVEGQGLGDLDHLLVADPQVADPGPRRDRRAQAVEQPARPGLHRAVVQPAQPAAPRLLAAQEDVVGDRELRDEVQLLVDDPDAGVLGLARPGEPHRPAVQADLAVVVGDRAGQDLHQRALARAVLAADRVDLAGRRDQRDVAQRAHAAEVLGDVPHLQPGGDRDRRAGVTGLNGARALAHGWVDPSGASRNGSAARPR